MINICSTTEGSINQADQLSFKAQFLFSVKLSLSSRKNFHILENIQSMSYYRYTKAYMYSIKHKRGPRFFITNMLSEGRQVLHMTDVVIAEYLNHPFLSDLTCSVRNVETGRKPLTNRPARAASVLHAANSIDDPT